MLHLKRWSTRPSNALCLTVLAAALILAPSLAAAGGYPVGDGIVVDPARSVVYLMSPSGLEAVDLAGGRLIWKTSAAARPLLVAGDSLVAQAAPREPGVLEVVQLSRRTGALQGVGARIDLPEGVWARVADGPGTSFSVDARMDGQAVVVSWLAQRLAGPVQGTLPRRDGETRSNPATAGYRRLAGAARLDLASGRVTPMSGSEPATRAGLAAMDLTTSADGQRRELLSADHRHRLVSERLDAADPWRAYRWTVVSQDTGTVLGEIVYHASVAPFVVAGGRLLFESRPFGRPGENGWVSEPRKLRAFDLAAGAELWSREVRSTDYRGPFPP